MIDAALYQELQTEQAHDRFFCAHLALAGLPGAGAFLTAPPVADGREIDAQLCHLKKSNSTRVLSRKGYCLGKGLVE